MAELTDYMFGKVMSFRAAADDAEIEQVILVDVTDTADGEIEFGFNVPSQKRRIYLRLSIAAVRAVLPDEDEQP